MNTFHHSHEHAASKADSWHLKSLSGYWHIFLDWADTQEGNRTGWLAATLVIHGSILFPMTVINVAMAGNSLPLLFLSIIGLMAMFTVNLAQSRQRIILPIFFASVLVDVLINLICLVDGLHPSQLFLR